MSFISKALFIVLTLFSALPALAQEELGSSRYFDERRKGDEASRVFKQEFAFNVCKASLAAYCPKVSLDTISDLSSCSNQQLLCGAPTSEVADRFISKYGVGTVSANQVVLPMINQAYRLLSEIEMSRRNHSSGFTARVLRNIPKISKYLGITQSEVKIALADFMTKAFPGGIAAVYVDYWGYFQQQFTSRTRFKQSDGDKVLTLSFRWCGDKYQFVNESKNIEAFILSAAIWGFRKENNLPSADRYVDQCEKLDPMPIDFGKYKITDR